MPATDAGRREGEVVGEVVPALLSGQISDGDPGQMRALERAIIVRLGQRPEFECERAGEVGRIARVFEGSDGKVDFVSR